MLLTCAVLGLAAHTGALAQAPATASASTPPLYSPDNDPYFAQHYIDIDEWRDTAMRHRYVHGGFKGTETRFSFYFPPKEQYQGRFFQHITPVPKEENLVSGIGAFTFCCDARAANLSQAGTACVSNCRTVRPAHSAQATDTHL